MAGQAPYSIKIELSDLQLLPHKASPDSAAYDLKAREDYYIAPGQTVLVATGLKLALPAGFEAQIRPRSGLSVKSRLRLSNSPGTIDADFRDEIKIIVHNAFSQQELASLLATASPLLDRYGPISRELSLLDYLLEQGQDGAYLKTAYPATVLQQSLYLNQEGRLWGTEHIMQYERIAQMLCLGLMDYEFELVDQVKDFGSDRGGGFGHSGRI
ncbi:MAG: hypothetical protein Q4D97_01200 [Eubacteriales bacterium]|nr:hypothetical protein [Eubacteriales bacterium]